MESFLDIINSPLFLIGVFVLIAIVIVVRSRRGSDRRCGECGQGTMEQCKLTPEGMVSSHASSTTGSATVNYTVEYVCSNCRAKLVRTERR